MKCYCVCNQNRRCQTKTFCLGSNDYWLKEEEMTEQLDYTDDINKHYKTNKCNNLRFPNQKIPHEKANKGWERNIQK